MAQRDEKASDGAKADNKAARDAKREGRTYYNRPPQVGGPQSDPHNNPSDSPGASSSRSRSTTSGADKSTSASSGRGGGSAPGSTSSHEMRKRNDMRKSPRK
jgi:hypothetical protein